MDLREIDAFLKRESWEEAMSGWENAALPVLHREENHTCLRHLTYVECRDGEFHFSCPENASRFREGDRVFVNPDGTEDRDLHQGFSMEWLGYDPVAGLVILAPSFESRRIPFPFKVGFHLMVDQGVESLQDAVSDMLASLAPKSTTRNMLGDFLSGQLTDRTAVIDETRRERILAGWPLNDGQTRAFDQAIRRFPISGVQGPPGTGKTRVLAALAAYYATMGFEVLVSSVSHFAINHALNQCAKALVETGTSGLVAKLSRNKNQGLSRGVQKFRSIQNLGPRKQGEGLILGLTPFRLPTQTPAGDFKVLLFDEAGQANLPLALLAMAHAKKTIFIGDHRQLSPIVLSEHHPPDFSPSAFSHLASKFPERTSLLAESYRMGPELIEFPSRNWYGGRLTSHPQRAQATWNFPGIEAIRSHPILNPDLPSVFVPVQHKHRLKYSDEEALVLVDLIATLKAAGAPAHEMAILVPFRGQQNRILRFLHERFGEDPWRKDLVVDTVDRLQGQERDLIFYSLTMSDPQRLRRISDFFFDAGRFNVALTRARFKRILVGSPEILRVQPQTLPGLGGLNTFSKFLEHTPWVPTV